MNTYITYLSTRPKQTKTNTYQMFLRRQHLREKKQYLYITKSIIYIYIYEFIYKIFVNKTKQTHIKCF